MTSTTVDTAIAAWKAAQTQADRDLATEAIEQHIAHETPEGGDYESATDEILSRLKAEFGPVPVEDLRDAIDPQRFYVALPASRDERAPQGIYGIGRTAEAALADAYAGSQTRAPSVGQDDEGDWVVSYEGTYEAFPTEAEAQGYACELGFRAEPCTEALYRRVEAEGFSDSGRNSYTFEARGGVYELVDRDSADEEHEEVLPRLEGDDGKVLDAEAELPSGFTYYDAEGTEYAYRYLGQEQYEVRRWMPNDQMWWVEPSERLDDDTTVEQFLVWKENA